MPVYFNEYVMCEIQANPVINQVFRRKTQVIKIMNVGGCGGGGGGGWAVSREGVNILFPEHSSATLGNILMVLGNIIEQVSADCRCKNDNFAYLGVLITSPYPYFY